MIKKALLYTCPLELRNFRYSLASGPKRYKSVFETLIPPSKFSILDSVNGVVFVGPQTSRRNKRGGVFETLELYFDFVDLAHEKKLYIASVMFFPTTLPKKDRGIDYTILLDGRERGVFRLAPSGGIVTPEEIRGDLENFFDRA